VSDDGVLSLRAVVSSPDGKTLVKREGSGSASDAAGIGHRVGEALLAAGAREILAVVYGHGG